MKKKVLYFVIALLISGVTNSQGVSPSVEFAATPTVSALVKYVDTPVGYYSGTPNINIPLYEINTSGYTLPISLSYNASGVKVAQEASNVGLGWSLNAGGIITRQIRGSDDFKTIGAIGYFSSKDYYNKDLSADDFLECTLTTDFNQICQNTRDLEPDLFIFNFGNYSLTLRIMIC